LENKSSKPSNQTKNRHHGSVGKSQLTLSQDMLKKGDVIVVADDDYEVRTSVSQNRVTATLCTEELLLRTQYMLVSPHFSQVKIWGNRRSTPQLPIPE
jgi:hypothetical protein